MDTPKEGIISLFGMFTMKSVQNMHLFCCARVCVATCNNCRMGFYEIWLWEVVL